MLGLVVPDYGYTLSDFPVNRYMMELVISSLFLILGTPLARRLVQMISPAYIGRIFEKSRNRWKKATYGIKRENLST
ncbi:MAG: hypothetical protein V1775_03240 [Bacteroidota bacterium]